MNIISLRPTNKKAQVSMAMIIGVTLVLIIGLGFYLRATSFEEDSGAKVEDSLISRPVKLFIDSCVEETLKDGILFTGKQGLYYELPEPYSINAVQKTTYYFLLGAYLFPTIETQQEELGRYIDEQLFFCLRNFKSFRDQGYDIEFGEISSSTTITNKMVIAKVIFPVKLTLEGSTSTISEYNAEVQANILRLRNDVESFMNEQMLEPGSICMSCLLDTAIENDYTARLNQIPPDEFIFTITDETTMIEGEPYQLTFANKYLILS